jgi:hypothetical protein
MSVYVGYFPYEFFVTEVHNSPVTAIVAVHTPDGFVIGADGRRMDGPVVITEQAQKLFSFDAGAFRLVYGWAGTTQMSDNAGRVLYDLISATQEILPAVALQESDNFLSFVDIFCKKLSKKIPARITNMLKEDIARILFVGYCQDEPCMARIELLYPDSYLTPKIGICMPERYGRNIFSGSENIFSKGYKQYEPQSSAEAIDFVWRYIQDCANSSAPDCSGIGGHIHIAELTVKKFSWIEPPNSASSFS